MWLVCGSYCDTLEMGVEEEGGGTRSQISKAPPEGDIAWGLMAPSPTKKPSAWGLTGFWGIVPQSND